MTATLRLAVFIDLSRGLVLVVEDESTIADVIRRYLVAAGFSVRTTGRGREAQAIIRRDRDVRAGNVEDGDGQRPDRRT